MTYGRQILSLLCLPISPRPRAHAFQRFGWFRQRSFAAGYFIRAEKPVLGPLHHQLKLTFYD
jgi:hypothetical protein